MYTHRNQSAAYIFERRLEAQANEIGLRDRSIVLAVSGGPDSLALAAALRQLREALRLSLTLVYVDHRLRGVRASRQERRSVSRLAHRFAMPLRIVDLGSELRQLGGTDANEGIEAQARRARYRALIRVAEERGADGVCVAHHREDQVETVIMRLLSGSSVEGLAGMRRVSERGGKKVYRPMLAIEQSLVREYGRYMALSPVYDRTNRERTRLRSRVRETVLPSLEKTRWGAVRAIARTAAAMADAADALAYYTAESGAHALEISETPHEGVHIPMEHFIAYPRELRLRLLQSAVHMVSGTNDFRIPRRFFSSILEVGADSPGGRYGVGHGVELRVEDRRVRVLPARVIHNTASGYRLVDENGAVVRNKLPEPFPMLCIAVESSSDAYFPPAWCRPPIGIRHVHPNDGRSFEKTRSGFKRMIESAPDAWMMLEDRNGALLLLHRFVSNEVHYEYPSMRVPESQPSEADIASNDSYRCHEVSIARCGKGVENGHVLMFRLSSSEGVRLMRGIPRIYDTT